MTDVQTICVSVIIVALILCRCFELLMRPLEQAIKEFDLDEVEVVGRSVKVRGKK